MKILFGGFASSLTFAQARNLSRNYSEPINLPEQLSCIKLNVSSPLDKWQTGFLFDYEIFPTNILRYKTEWSASDRSMACGDIILQTVIVPPFRFGVCIEFAVRISRIIHQPDRIGFGYETLSGHVESGISEFYFEQRSDGAYFVIRTLSEPAHFPARLTKSFIAQPYQAWCTRQALASVKAKFESLNSI